MVFLLAYLYVHHLIFLLMVWIMHIKLVNTFGNWLIGWGFTVKGPIVHFVTKQQCLYVCTATKQRC